MRLTLSAYVTVQREEGRSIYSCRPLRGPQMLTRDPLLSIALSKLGNKMRKSIKGWIEGGEASRLGPWLFDSDAHAVPLKLTLALRDRTLRWKLLIVCIPAFSRIIAFSPSIPEVAFELESQADLEFRASAVYGEWAQQQIAEGSESIFEDLGAGGDMWVEPLEVEVESTVRDKKRSEDIFAALFGGEASSGSEELHKVGQCLDELASDFQPAFGRSDLVDEVDRLLQRDDRQGVLLVGPPAVGKTAIINECVQRRTARFHNRRDQKPQVWWLSPQRLISGMSYLGQWEQRWLSILRESSKRDHILYFDDLVGLFTAGRTRDSSLSTADVLRGFLAEHPLRILAEATAEQLAVLRRRDRSLADRFHLVHVPALSAADALPLALEATYDIEIRSQRYFHPETVPLVIRHQETFAPDQAFPGKAIEMCKTLTKHASLVIDRNSVLRLASAQMGASSDLLINDLGNQKRIQHSLSRQLIGQPAALEALSRVVIRYAQRLHALDRPLGVLLLLGPTGVGKTEAAKALTRLLYTDDSHLVRIDMNEVTTPYAAEQLVGNFESPDGRLTSAVRRQPNCVILLDEIEKAHPDVFDYLLQVLGEGRLTDARGRVADFRSTVIIMTSNLGASQQHAQLGFETSNEQRQQIYIKAAQRFFRPEFFNRIDEVVAFRSLDPQDMEHIVAMQMDQVLARDGLQRRDVFVDVNQAATKHIIQRGYDSKLGARAVRRMLETQVMGPLGDCLAGLLIDRPTLIQISHPAGAEELSCRVQPLEIIRPKRKSYLRELEPLIESGTTLYQRLDARLIELEGELRDTDRRTTGKTHGASYYSLREQLYRCSEAIKAAKARSAHPAGPRFDISPVAPTLARRDPDGSGTRRTIKDWHAQEDLRSAIADQLALQPHQPQTTDQLAQQLINNLTIAKVMIDAAQTSRSWLFGWELLTNADNPLQSIASPADHLLGDQLRGDSFLRARGDPHGDSHYALQGRHSSAPTATAWMLRALRAGWQYEVAEHIFLDRYWLVSGVSLIGILRPLLGTYRMSTFPWNASGTSAGASHLVVLKAVSVPEQCAHEFAQMSFSDALPSALSAELSNRILSEPLTSEGGELRTPTEQIWPTTVIRGELSKSIVDYHSGAQLDMLDLSWQEPSRALAQAMQWWTDCLPVPPALDVGQASQEPQ